MSTNPFDDDNDDGGGGGGDFGGGSSSIRTSKQSHSHFQQHHHASQKRGHYPPASQSQSYHPPPTAPSNPTNYNNASSSTSGNATISPIWAARGVEWPLPSALNAQSYRRWRRESKAVGAAVGISGSGIRWAANDMAMVGSGSGGGGSGSSSGGDGRYVDYGGAAPSAFVSMPDGGVEEHRSGMGRGDASVASDGMASASAGSAAGSGGYGGLTGLMGRVLGASSQSASATAASLTNDIEEEDLAISATRPVLPPRSKCVAASNGWIVAATECGYPPAVSSSTSFAASASSSSSGANPAGGPPLLSKHGLPLTSLIPPLRLICRWNVRRGTSLGSEGNHLVPLPPPVRPSSSVSDESAPTGKTTPSNATNDPHFGRIVHTFVDPTGCHVLLSARNGEAYYLHSTSKKVRKLAGFGPSADGSYSGFVSGVPFGEAGGNGTDQVVQTGLTPGSHITAVGWDRDRGTEGSTKRILLGTSHGEIYEYSLLSPNASPSNTAPTSAFSVNLRSGTSSVGSDGGVGIGLMGKGSKTSAFDTKAGELGAIEDGEEPIETPVLLCRLNASAASRSRNPSGGHDGVVGGILFQRVVGGMVGRSTSAKEGPAASTVAGAGYVIVLASTGGMHRHTRLHTFRSEPSKGPSSLTLRSAFSRQAEGAGRGSFVELPGSVEFADLRSCNDGFAMRTETGIYYGTLERAGSSSASVGSGIGGIVDAGMLPYDSIQGNNARRGGSGIVVPASIGLTPHHFVTLSSANEVCFINRVAKKIIQKERVDWVSVTQSSSHDESHGGGGFAELLTDIRRPDQIWLRKARSLVHISSSCEDRDVWKYTLTKCIETAPHHTNAAQRGAVAADTSGSRHVVPSGLSTIPPLTSEEKHLETQFEHAKSLCSNYSQKAVVNAVRAEYHLSQGRVELGAKYMAQCPPTLMPFADTAVRLALPMLGADESVCYKNSTKASEALATSNMALITFLSDKMKVAKSKKGSEVCTMLGAWLTELHLHERERDGSGKPVYLRQSQCHTQPVNHALLHQFLSSYVRDMDAKTIINVLASHDISAGECAGYSAASGDIGAAINASLYGEGGKNGALDALRFLNDSSFEKAEPYYYKHASTLLSRAPMAASTSFLSRYTEGLSEMKLLPAFMDYEQKRSRYRKYRAAAATSDVDTSNNLGQSQSKTEGDKNLNNERGEVFHSSTKKSGVDSTDIVFPSMFVDDEHASIKYLEGVIKLGSQSQAIYNYLTSLYAAMEDEGPLFRFLSAHVLSTNASVSDSSVSELLMKQANDRNSSLLDKSYALRTVLRTGRHFRSAVKLYMGFGMRQQAVELALKVDPSLARELARQSDDKDERKRLWLMIARNASANRGFRDGKDVVARVVSVLKDCGPDVLSIEDVLPFLPDFAQIDQFKDEICEALASYSSKIEHYLKEMNECDQTCDALRDELSRLRTVGTHVRADARCAFTNKYVLDEGEPFYAFPSGYVVLESALKREVLPHLNKKQRERVEFIESELARLRAKQSSKAKTAYELAKDEYDMGEYQTELDGLIAAECPLTGSVMVESIDLPFPDDNGDDFM